MKSNEVYQRAAEIASILGIDYETAERIVTEHPQIADKILYGEELTDSEMKIVEKYEQETLKRLSEYRLKKKLESILKEEGVPQEFIPYIVRYGEVPKKQVDKRWNIRANITNKILSDAKGRDLLTILKEEPNKIRLKAKLIRYGHDIADAMESYGNEWVAHFETKQVIRGAGAAYLLSGHKSKKGRYLTDVLMERIRSAVYKRDLNTSGKIVREIKKAHGIAKNIKAKERREKKRKKRLQKKLPI